jgi:hypothetical protein
MIGSYDSLLKASQGRMAPRVVTPPAPPVQPGGLAENISANSLAQAQMASGPSLLSGFNRASGGLSAKGKYSGFFSAGDQQAAIEGAAMDLKGDAATYRAKADAFINKLNPAYSEARTGAQRTVRGSMGFNPQSSSAASFRMFEETSQDRTAPLRAYANDLNDWYAQQSAPAVKYRATAEQIDRTPISEFATQIATNSYGMNPDLARGKFANLDETYYKQQRDAQSLRENKMPYDEFKAQEEDLAFGTTDKKINSGIEAQAAASLDKIAGVGSKFLSAATGQTAAQMYATVTPQFKFTDPNDKVEKIGDGQYFVQQYGIYLDEGNMDKANQLLNSVPADRQDLKRLLQALQSVKLQKMGKAAIGTMTYESFLADLGG